jgi:hypothetical protein
MPYRPSGVAPQAARASTSEELQEESGRHSERAKVRKDKPYVWGLEVESYLDPPLR